MVRSFHDVVAWFDLDSDRVFRQDLDENLHSASQPKNKVKYWLFLDVVVAKKLSKLFPGEDESLLTPPRDALFVLNVPLHILNTVSWFNLNSTGLSS